MAKSLSSGDAQIQILNDYIALVETHAGVMLDTTKIRKFYDLIENQFKGDYSLIIDRKNKYQLMRFEVYKEANRHDRLKGIAIVTRSTAEKKMAEIERPLSEKPFSTFDNLDSAIAWVETLHQS